MSGESTHDALLRLAHEKREMHERRYIERFGLCPDHRDKPTGVCPLCTIETRTRQRDALLAALRECFVMMDIQWNTPDYATDGDEMGALLDRARLAIAKATTDTTEKP